MKHRKGRVEGEILRELTKIIRRDIRDPRVSGVTFTAVECSGSKIDQLIADLYKQEEDR